MTGAARDGRNDGGGGARHGTTIDHGGVLNELVRGEWVEPGTGTRHGIPLDDVVVRDSLDGAEAELVRALHPGESLTVVSDPRTRAALGERVFRALAAGGLDVREHVWETPASSERGVAELRTATRGTDALIAVGSGTINDTVKYAAFLDGRPYSVFATSPMTAYTTSTASITSDDGLKGSITCRGARGAFFDLSVLADCPKRLVAAAFADVICRTTSQVDWLLSHLLLGTRYVETPYALLAIDEPGMIGSAAGLAAGDTDALAALTRISALMGLGTTFTDTTHSGSMHEHMISHWIDMFAGDLHPGTSHGEQVGVATVTMSDLQNRVLGSATPPILHATDVPEAMLRARYPADVADGLIRQSRAKALSGHAGDALNRRLETEWPAMRERLAAVALPLETVWDAMGEAGCRRTATELGLDAGFYRDTVSNARWMRDRFGALDLVGDSAGLERFVSTMRV